MIIVNNLLAEITKQLRTICPESYYERNRKTTVIYPYLTFDVDGDNLEVYRDGFYLDIDIFDINTSFKSIFEIEDKLRIHFRQLAILTDDFLLQFKVGSSNKIPTESDNLKRRNLQLYVKVDWRNI